MENNEKHWKYIAIFLIAAFFVSMYGCKKIKEDFDKKDSKISLKNPADIQNPLPEIDKNLDKSRKDLDKSTDSAVDSVEEIKTVANDPKSEVPDEPKQKINDSVEKTLAQLSNVKNINKVDLQIVANSLKIALKSNEEKDKLILERDKIIKKNESDYNNLKKEYDKTKEENTALINQSRKHIYTILGVVIAASVVSVGVSVFMFVQGNGKFAIALGAASVVMASFAVSFITFWTQIAWLGYGAIVAIVVIVSWQIYLAIKKTSDEKNQFKKAFQETVSTVEVIKPHLSDDAVTKIFGKQAVQTVPVDGLASRIQSQSTIDLIKKEREVGT